MNNGGAQNSSYSSSSVIEASTSDNDMELRFQYSFDTVPSGSPELDVEVRKDSSGSLLDVVFFTNKAQVWKYTGGTWTKLDENTGVSTSTSTKYDVRIVADGSNLKVYRSTGGGVETQIFNTSSVPTYSGTKFLFVVSPNLVTTIGKVMVLADDLSRTTTFTVASNNELSTMADYNGSNTFTYDDWGRMISKTRSGVSAVYDYGYGMKLTKVTSTYPNEGTVTYQFGGDGKRRSRSVSGGDFTWYNWDVGFNVIEEEAQGAGLGDGALAKTYIASPPGMGFGSTLAEVTGSTPDTGSYSYILVDNIRTNRALYDQSKARTATFEYTPYGSAFSNATATLGTPRFAGLLYDSVTHQFLAPFRSYAPDASRWTSLDPLGMAGGPNQNVYVHDSPAGSIDPSGLLAGLVVILAIALLVASAEYGCAMSVGEQEMEHVMHMPGLNSGNKEHCYVACQIEKQCGMSLGWLAAYAIEVMQGHGPWDWNDDSRRGVLAGQVGANLADEGCDCEQGCKRQYSWEEGGIPPD